MERVLSILVMSLTIVANITAQHITLKELTSICNMKTWGDADIFVKSKNWRYQSSNDSTTMYFYPNTNEVLLVLYDYDTGIKEVRYGTSNQNTYLNLMQSVKTEGYKNSDNEVSYDRKTAWYKKKGYFMRIQQSPDEGVEIFVFSLAKAFSGLKWVHPNENEKRLYNYVDGELNGIQKFYYKGNLVIESTFVNGESNGPCIFYLHSYNDDWQVKIKGNYKNGMIGKWNAYVVENGQERLASYFTMDKNSVVPPCWQWENDSTARTFVKGENGMVICKTYKLKDYSNNETTYTMSSFFPTFTNGSFTGGMQSDFPIIYDYFSGLKFLSKISRLSTIDLSKLYLHEFAIIKDSKIVGVEKTYTKSGEISSLSYYDNEGKLKEIEYLNTKETGGLLGKVSHKVPFKDNKANGIAKYYDSKQHVVREVTYVNDVEDGEARSYYTSDPEYKGERKYNPKCAGKLYKKEFFSTGENNGTSIYYDAYGKIVITIDYKNDKINGHRKFYYTSDYNFNDIMDLYYPQASGKLSYEDYYVNGEPNGLYRYYDRNGQITTEGKMLKGQVDGEVKKYYTSDSKFPHSYRIDGLQAGKLYSIENYKAGKLNGICFLYRNGKKIQSETFSNGDKKRVDKYNNNEEIFESFEMKWGSKGWSHTLQKNGYTIVHHVKEGTGVINIDNELFSPVSSVDELIITKENICEHLEFLSVSQSYDLIKNTYKITSGETFGENQSNWTFYKNNVEFTKSFSRKNDNYSNYTDAIFKNSDGSYFTGTYKDTDNCSNCEVEIPIKEGLVNGAVKYTDRTSGKVIKKEKYKDGILK